MKLLTVVGARPQFVKAGVVSKALAKQKNIQEIVVHTGQHYDPNMSEIFFTDLKMPKPDYQLEIHGGSHGEMTGRMLIELERVLQESKPDRMLVYGDTNSTLAGALAAAKLHVPVAHIEAGLRSFNMKMPEEINRILTDRVSDMLFCPTDMAVTNLRNEGISSKNARIIQSGDVMEDSARLFTPFATLPSQLGTLDNFILVTLHRAENTDDPKRLAGILAGLNRIHQSVAPVILPLHPRTRAVIEKLGIDLKVTTIDPVGYLDMLGLLNRCSLVITDSGGLQKEAFFFRKPCITVRDQTEWVELIEIGANELCPPDEEHLIALAKKNLDRKITDDQNLYGGGQASLRIAESLAIA